MAALVHGPEILFLDEPTIGLDVVAKARVRTFLAELNRARGTTILVTSHDMDDIEALCSRVLLINHGRIGFDGDLAALVRAVQPDKLIRATFASPVDGAPLLVRFAGDITMVGDDADEAVISLSVARDRLSDVLEALPGLGPLVDLSVADAEVEAIIRDLFTREAATVEPSS
jgi:ABC-2 type transport system ATP-binding protein